MYKKYSGKTIQTKPINGWRNSRNYPRTELLFCEGIIAGTYNQTTQEWVCFHKHSQKVALKGSSTAREGAELIIMGIRGEVYS